MIRSTIFSSKTHSELLLFQMKLHKQTIFFWRLTIEFLLKSIPKIRSSVFLKLLLLFLNLVVLIMVYERKYSRSCSRRNHLRRHVAATHQSFETKRRRRFIFINDSVSDFGSFTLGLVWFHQRGIADHSIQCFCGFG